MQQHAPLFAQTRVCVILARLFGVYAQPLVNKGKVKIYAIERNQTITLIQQRGKINFHFHNVCKTLVFFRLLDVEALSVNVFPATLS